jgi:alkylhydroperoxidase family enzyme
MKSLPRSAGKGRPEQEETKPMARLPYLDKKDLAPENQDLLDRPINLNRVLVNSPNCRRAGLKMAHFIRYESRLDARLKELAIMAIGYITRAPYEWSHHVILGKDFGVSDDDMQELINYLEGRPHKLDERAVLAIDAAREMTEDIAMSDKTFDALHGFLNNEEMVDLVVTIAHYNAMVRVLATLQVDIEDNYLPGLDKFPLPA